MLKAAGQARPLLITYLICISLAAVSILTGCSSSEKASAANPPAPADSRQQAAASAVPETDAETPEIPDEPAPTEPPPTEANWAEPPDPRDYPGSTYWALRNAFALPDFRAPDDPAEIRTMTRKFFLENPEIIDQIWAESDWFAPRVLLMDVTGDHTPEVLIQYFEHYCATHNFGGIVNVYDLVTAQCIGDFWTNDPWCENMGWYESPGKDERSFLVMDHVFFRTKDQTGLSTELHHYAYILWEINYDGVQLNASPLWLLMNTIWYNPKEVEISEWSLIDPSYELAAGFSKDPYSWFETVKSMAIEGCDPVIRDMILQLQPAETTCEKYAVIDEEGLHLWAD